MEKQPDRYVQNDRIWNPIEEKWEFRNHFHDIEEDSFRDRFDFGGKLGNWGERVREKDGELLEREDRTHSGGDASASKRIPSVSGKSSKSISGKRSEKAVQAERSVSRQSHQSRGISSASGNGSTGTWKMFQSVLVGVIFFIVFGNLLVGILNMLLFGII